MLKGLGAALLNPVAAGIAWVLGVAWVASAGPLVAGDEAVLGKNAPGIADLVVVRYAGEIRRVGLELGGIAAAAGAALGLAATALLAARDALRGRRPRLAGPGAAARGLAIVAALHAGVVARWMAEYPQLYSGSFWQRGGLRAAAERFVTDRLHPLGVDLVLVAFAVAVLLGRPTQWKARLGVVARTLRSRWRPLAWVAAASAAGLLVAGPLAHVPRAAAAVHPDRPNIVVLASDGLRADRLGPAVTPNLDGLAARGTRFERAYTAMPRTFGSWISLLTGRYPHHHGVRSDFPRFEQTAAPFDALPRRLAQAGYATAVVSDYAGDVFGRVDLGFGLTRAPRASFPGLIRQKALQRMLPVLPALQSHRGRALVPDLDDMSLTADPELLADDAIDALRSLEDRPFFLVVFFSTTHFPYAAPSPHWRRFTDPAYDGAFRYEKTFGLGSAVDAPPADVRQTRALYDGAAYAVDAAAGRILDALARDGLGDDTIVVVTSDHGENLYEHGHGQGHGDHLFGDEGTHVPLAVYDPRARAPHAERAVVSSVDLAPTLAELAGVAPPAGADGRSLAGAVRGGPLPSAFVYSETELWLVDSVPVPPGLRAPTPGLFDLLEVDDAHGGQLVTKAAAEPATLFARHRMVRDGRWKLVYAPTPAGVRWILVDTREDPDELVDRSASAPDELARMQAALWPWMLSDPGMTREGDYLVPRGADLARLLAR